MDNNKVNIINGAVVGVQLGTPMQDATPAKPEDNEAYATERNTVTNMPNFNTEENLEKQPEPTGGGGLTELPEGYPYKTGVTIEWDGNTEGKDCVADRWYRVSDEVISNETLKIGTITISNGVNAAANTNWDSYVSAGYITEDFAMVADGLVIVVRKPNVPYMEVTFEKTGIYFARMSASFRAAKLSAETVQPMAEEFMPLLTSPNGTKYKLTVADDGTLSAVVVS